MNDVEERIKVKYGEDNLVELKKIFYSNKVDSCLYSFYISENVGYDNFFNYKLVDALTGEILFERTGCLLKQNCGYTTVEASIYIDDKIKEYE